MGVNVPALLERFQLPMNPPGQVQVQAPASGTAPEGDTPAPDAQSGKAPESAASEATLAITATDLASIVYVDEGRKSVGLAPVGGETGGKWIREHAAKLAAEIGAPVDGSSASPAPTSAPALDKPDEPEGEEKP
jgi:hypothetical protein